MTKETIVHKAKSSSFIFIMGMLISIGFVLYAIFKMDLKVAFNVLLEVKLYGVCLFFIAQCSSLLLRSLCWSSILDSVKKISLSNLFKAECIGNFSNSIFPARFGELVRTYFISKEEKLKFATVLGTVVVERALDLFNISILALIALLIAKPESMPSGLVDTIRYNSFMLSIFIFFIFFIGYYYLSKNILLVNLVDKTFTILPNFITVKLQPQFFKFLEGLQSVTMLNKILPALIFSFLMWWTTLLTLYSTLLMFSYEATIKISAVLTVALAFGKLIPSSPGHIGPMHAALIFALGLYGIDSNLGLGFAIGYHVVSFSGAMILASLSLWSSNTSLFKIKRSIDLIRQ